MSENYELATLGVRAGQLRSEFHEHAESLFLTSSFVFDNAPSQVSDVWLLETVNAVRFGAAGAFATRL